MTPERYPGAPAGASADIRVAGHAEPPRVLVAPARARGRCASDTPGASGGGDAVVDDARPARATRSVPSSAPVEAERLGEAGRARAAVAVARAPSAAASRITLEPVDRRARRAAAPRAASPPGGDDVRAPVHAVGEVHVQVPGRPEHRRGARRRPAVRVAARVVATRGTPRPRRCAPPDARRRRSSCTSTLFSSSRRELERVAVVERRGSVRPRLTRAAASQRACSSSRARAVEQLRLDRRRARPRRASCAARPPRRARAAASASGPRSGSVEHQLVERHAPLDRLAHERADDARAPRGTACPARTSCSARSVAAHVLAVGRRAACAPRRTRPSPAARRRAEREPARVERVEQRLLVLLQVAVVREREALQRGEEAGEVADQPARLAARELGDVGVLLLRQHRRAGACTRRRAGGTRTPRSTTARSPRRCARGAPA